jgi:hypothetical protein
MHKQIPPTEIFDIIAQHRNKIMKWLRANESSHVLNSNTMNSSGSSSHFKSNSGIATFSSISENEMSVGSTVRKLGTDDVLEGIVRVITSTGDRHAPKGEDTR